MADKTLNDYRFTVSFAMSRGHIDSLLSRYWREKSNEKIIANHVKQELAKRIAEQIVIRLEETIEPCNAEGGNKEWKLEVVAIPYDVLVGLLDTE